MKINFLPKFETINEFIQEMKSYKFRLKNKNLILNLNSPKKIYNINLTTNFKPKIHANKIKNRKSLSTFSIYKPKKEKYNNNMTKYNYNNIFVYQYKKKLSINQKIEKINSIKDRDKYLVRGLALTKSEKRYFIRCSKPNKDKIDLIGENKKINNNFNTAKRNRNMKNKTLNLKFSLISSK